LKGRTTIVSGLQARRLPREARSVEVTPFVPLTLRGTFKDRTSGACGVV